MLDRITASLPSLAPAEQRVGRLVLEDARAFARLPVRELAARALGAEGINMGTRFIATQEAPVHDNVKRAIVAASELDTRLVMRPLRNTERVLTNGAAERLLQKERELGAAITFADIAPEVAGVYPRIMQDGDMEAGVWSCGMVAGLIHDVPTVQQLIDSIMAQADALISERLAGLLRPAA